ncbi:MAG: hypothetical protein D6679_01825 [Candidatus Hydrogenedentota bacterium]|nr:MAG: hypothetical protein D6679_01825 [Candidatus Hydrogenedentota bacterium]
MKDAEIIQPLGSFATAVRKNVKGLSSRIVWYAYGMENEFEAGGASQEDFTLKPLPKNRVDWETYVLAQGAGALQGHMTGRIDPDGTLNQDKKTQFIHQILPENFAFLASRCRIPGTGTGGRLGLLLKDPVRASAILFFQEYLRSIYKSVAGADETLLLKLLADLPGSVPPKELLASWRENEEILKKETRNPIYEPDENHQLRIYVKEGKKKKLVNGWLFGTEEEPEEEERGAKEIPAGTDYDRRIEKGAFYTRMMALLDEAAFLIGPDGSAVLDAAVEIRSGAVGKMVQAVQKFTDLADSRQLTEQHAKMAESLISRLETLGKIAGSRGRLLESVGLDREALKTAQAETLRLKRKLRIQSS